jgi:Spy/CpxP family protein refolding chaperone
MIKRIIAVAVLSFSSLAGQEPGTAILPAFPQQWDQLKQYLVLTEAQVSSLEQLRQNRLQQEQGIYRQMAEKQRQMYELLQQGSNDTVAIGRLMVDINNLSRQLPLKGDTYRTEVLAQLTPAQKTKLPGLSEALKLQSVAWQAIELNMIDNPNIPDARILPVPLNAISARESVQNLESVRNVR